MAFELEPLGLKSLIWVETPSLRGIMTGKSPVVPVTDSELAAALEAIVKLQPELGTDVTLQKLLIHLRLDHHPVRLSTLLRAIEILHANRMLSNPGAAAWLGLFKPKPQIKISLTDRVRDLFSKSTAPPVSQDPKEWEQLPIIRQLEPSARQEILRGATVRQVPRGIRLCRQGGLDRNLMILLSGQAAVIKKTSNKKRQTVAVLNKHAMFGETSYFLNEPRTADVVALSECQVLCMPPQVDGVQLHQEQFQRLQTRLWFLQALGGNPLFNEIPAEAFDALLLNGTMNRFAAGQTLVKENEAADACYFLINGTTAVSRNGELINRLTSGSVIGEVALMVGRGGRTATVKAETEVTVIKYDWKEFWSVLSSHFVLGLAFEGLADKRLARDRARAS
jgi:CRP-like cAMP-binding protein